MSLVAPSDAVRDRRRKDRVMMQFAAVDEFARPKQNVSL
jgi:hypothetical protein